MSATAPASLGLPLLTRAIARPGRYRHHCARPGVRAQAVPEPTTAPWACATRRPSAPVRNSSSLCECEKFHEAYIFRNGSSDLCRIDAGCMEATPCPCCAYRTVSGGGPARLFICARRPKTHPATHSRCRRGGLTCGTVIAAAGLQLWCCTEGFRRLLAARAGRSQAGQGRRC